MPLSIIKHEDVHDLLSEPTTGSALRLSWLGQAGFAIRRSSYLVLIDPYLSDYLAGKYKNASFKHLRMTPPPISLAEAARADWILATHRHSDHLDPGALPVIIRRNKRLKIAAPRSALDHGKSIGLPIDRIAAVDAGETLKLTTDIQLEAIPSAHEYLSTDEDGRHHFLGYIINFGPFTIYHSGDCIPYKGLPEALAEKGVDLALLPINGRDDFRRARNVPGNFTLEEALGLCEQAGIPNMIAHHFGMFEFNTIDPDEARRIINDYHGSVNALLPEIDAVYELVI